MAASVWRGKERENRPFPFHFPRREMITITPLGTPPLSYILSLDSAQILLDCGLTESAPASYFTELRRIAPQLALVLLTHPTLHSLGALPFLKAHGATCTVYGTLPTREMGKYQLEEFINARSQEEYNPARQSIVDSTDHEASHKRRKGKAKEIVVLQKDEMDDIGTTWQFSKKEIRDAFTSITAIRWTQPVHLTGSFFRTSSLCSADLVHYAGPLKGYTLVAHRSGHTLGGTMYTLRPSLSSSLSPASSSSSLLYAPIFNHVKEHHLDGAALLKGAKIDEAMRRIGVVVVGAERSIHAGVKRVDRDKALLGAFIIPLPFIR